MKHIDTNGNRLLTVNDVCRRMATLPRRELFTAHFAKDFPSATRDPETGVRLYSAAEIEAWVTDKEKREAYRAAQRVDRKQIRGAE